MTDQTGANIDPMEVGDTEDRLDHTGGGSALTAEVTEADEEYVRRHTTLPEGDVDTEDTDAPSKGGKDTSSPVPGNTGATATTGTKR